MKSPGSMSPSSVSLEELRCKARSPEAGREELEALVMVLQRPVWPGQDVRGRAEVLKRIIEDPFLGGMRGSNGQRVDGLAARSLVALGEPHASTLSPQAVKALEHAPPLEEPSPLEEETETTERSWEEPKASSRPSSWRRFLGVCFLGLGVLELLCVKPNPPHGGSFGLAAGIDLFSLVLPTLPLLLSSGRSSNALRIVSAAVMAMVILPLSALLAFSGAMYVGTYVLVAIYSRYALILCLILAAVVPERRS